MAKFFVRQRVRVVAVTSPWNAYRVGVEDCISGFWDSGAIRLESHPLPDGSNAVSEWMIEPITPDGHRASEFSFTELMDRCREGVSA